MGLAIYITLATILFFGAQSSNPKRAYKFVFIILLFLSAFRHSSTGHHDVNIYIKYFESVPDLFHLSGFSSFYDYEIGYTILNSFVKCFSDNYYVFQIIYTLITMFLLSKIIDNLDFDYREKALFLFADLCFRFLWFEWATYRQNISDLLFAYFLIKLYKSENESLFRRIFCLSAIITLPLLFHSSGKIIILSLPILYVLGKVPVRTKRVIIPIVAVIIWISSSTIFSSILNALVRYVDDSFVKYELATAGGNYVNFILRIVIFEIYASFFEQEDYPHKTMLIDCLGMMILIGAVNNELMMRMYEYYSFALYGVMARFDNAFINENTRKLVQGAFYIGMVIILIRFVTITAGGYLVDFRFFF